MSLPTGTQDARISNPASRAALSRRKDPLPATLLALTVVTGIVDAVSFLGLGRVFTANMTGNVVFLGFAVAGAPGLSISRSLVSLVAFLVGAAIGGRLGAAMAEARRKAWLITTTLMEGLLLLAAGLAALTFDHRSASPASSLYAGIILTALAMGLRNATVRRLAVPDLTTTVLTLTLTGLAADSSIAGGANPRISRRVASVLLMFAGATVGSLLLELGLAMPLFLSGACVLIVTVVYLAVLPPTPAGGKTGAMKES
jgi:uncharacterized membrane protein YoaK (UPF0700 family)